METFFIYFLKVNGLLIVFYLAYYFFMQKETFFNSNRWFLLLGLMTSVLLPSVFISKIVLVEKSNQILNPISNLKSNTFEVIEKNFDWNLLLIVFYFVISLVFITFIINNLYSFFRLINKKKIEIQKPFAMIDINENINPFSFFKYIVFNSTLYSKKELDCILNHEKVHSREKHSIDVLIIKVFCAIFWVNPIIWLYKKAVLQNLEYIADQKATKNIEDKKAYQMTLLRVVTDHNCLSITNNFYQSLIKKRIVMLNKNQSQKLNSWKYFLVIPVVVVFIFLFQIKVEAHEKQNLVQKTTANVDNVDEIIINKNTTDSELKEITKSTKEKHDVDVKFKNVKRNKSKEIIAISVFIKDKKGYNATHVVESDEPIEDFDIHIGKDKNGNVSLSVANNDNSDNDSDNENYNAYNSDMPEPPMPPTPPTSNYSNNMPSPPTPPTFPAMPDVKTPTDPNDQKGWDKYEAEMEAYAKKWESTEMKKYEAEMEEYGRKMEALQPDMTEFDKKMEEFDAKMEAYQNKMEVYQEKLRDAADAKREAARDAKNKNK